MKMRISEAIRLGGVMRPRKCRKVFVDRVDDGACALGAAGLAVGLKRNEISADKLKEFWPYIAARVAREDIPFPFQCLVKLSLNKLLHVIICLNDDTDWTREQIADWVAQMEAKYHLGEEEPLPTKEESHETITHCLTQS